MILGFLSPAAKAKDVMETPPMVSKKRDKSFGHSTV